MKTTRNNGVRARKTGTRALLRRILVVCEGAKTEPNYFKSFDAAAITATVDVRGEGKNTTSLVDSAAEIVRKARESGRPYDEVWAVFDRDSFLPEAFNEAVRRAEAAGMRTAWSNEAFELWYLLHFDYIDAAISRSRYGGMLADKLGFPYAKNATDMRARLRAREPDAIRNAKLLHSSYSSETPPASAFPCTTVYRLVEALRGNVLA